MVAKMVEIKICPQCNSDRIRKVCRTVTRSAAGREYTVPDLEFYECPDCGEHFYGMEASRKIDASSPAITQNATRRKTA
jgi:YgiT-type zinc finger domain-containing protein